METSSTMTTSQLSGILVPRELVAVYFRSRCTVCAACPDCSIVCRLARGARCDAVAVIGVQACDFAEHVALGDTSATRDQNGLMRAAAIYAIAGKRSNPWGRIRECRRDRTCHLF